MWKISRVKDAVVDFLTGKHKEAQYGTQPVTPATPGQTSTMPQSTTPAPQPPAGMTCPAGQKMMLDPQTNQWKCMPEATAQKDDNTQLWYHIKNVYGIDLDINRISNLLSYLKDQDFVPKQDYYYAIEKWLESRGYKIPPEKIQAQLQSLPAKKPILKKLPERVDETEMVMTPVGPMQARVIGGDGSKVVARIAKHVIRAQELAILQDLAEGHFGVAVSNDQATELLRWLWKYRIKSQEEKVKKIGEWISLKGLESTLVRTPIAKIARQTGRAEIYAKIYVDKDDLETSNEVQTILKSNVSDEVKAAQIRAYVYDLMTNKIMSGVIDVKDYNLDTSKDIEYDETEIRQIIESYNDDLQVEKEYQNGKEPDLMAKKEGQLTDLMESHMDPHVDVFDWAVETYGPEDIIKKLELENTENLNLEDHREQINQVYLPSYKDQIMSSDFDELFDRKDPVIEEQEYDSEKDWLDTDEEDIYTLEDGCELDEAESGLTASKTKYKLVWKGETIEEDLDNEEADYLMREYTLAYGGGVRKIRMRGQRDNIVPLDRFGNKTAQGVPQQKTWVWDDKLGDWKQVSVMSEWDTLMERRLQRQGPAKAKLSGRKGQTQQLKVGDLLEAKHDGIRWTVVQLGYGDESIYIRPEGETKGGMNVRGDAWQVNYRLVPPAEVPISRIPPSSYSTTRREIMPGFASKKAQTQAQMEKAVPADITPVNPAPAVNRAEPLKPGEVPVILEDEDEGTVKPKGKTEEESQQEKQVDLSREEKVKKDVETLRDNIINLANSVYSIEMSDNQVTDLMGKVMGFLSESISEVTLGRVQDIVGDLLPRKARLSGRAGQRINKIWQVGLMDNGKYRQIEIELGPESDKQDVIEELKRRGEKGEILSIVTDKPTRLSNRKGQIPGLRKRFKHGDRVREIRSGETGTIGRIEDGTDLDDPREVYVWWDNKPQGSATWLYDSELELIE